MVMWARPRACLGHLARHVFVAEVNEHEVIVRAAADQVVTAVNKRRSHRLGILDHLLHVIFVAGLQAFPERHGLGSNHMLQRSALHAGEDTAVEQCAHFSDGPFGRFTAPGVIKILAHHDDAAARPAQCFVRGRGHDVAMRHWISEQTGSDQS